MCVVGRWSGGEHAARHGIAYDIHDLTQHTALLDPGHHMGPGTRYAVHAVDVDNEDMCVPTYLPDDVLHLIADHIEQGNGLRAGKLLRKAARACTVFASRSANHPDNKSPDNL